MRNEKQTKDTKISIWISCIVADKAKGYMRVCVCVCGLSLGFWGQWRKLWLLAFVGAKIAGQLNMKIHKNFRFNSY